MPKAAGTLAFFALSKVLCARRARSDVSRCGAAPQGRRRASGVRRIASVTALPRACTIATRYVRCTHGRRMGTHIMFESIGNGHARSEGRRAAARMIGGQA